MKIHPDWNSNGSVAITFDDDDEDASETYNDFSKFLNLFNVKFTTFKLKGSKTSSMVVPITIPTENNTSSNISDVPNEIEVNPILERGNEDTEDSEVNNDSTDNVVIKKKKKKTTIN